MRIRVIILGGLVLVGSFVAATLVINTLWPPAIQQQQQQVALTRRRRRCNRSPARQR